MPRSAASNFYFRRRRYLWLALASLTMTVSPASARSHADPLAPTARWSANTRGDAATPPMGWSSWNAFATLIDEGKLMANAHVLVDSGLASLGYRYVNIDDGWWLKRRVSDSRLIVRTRLFPSAATGGPGETSFRPLTDRLHAMGLKAGIYSDIGRNACSQRHDPHSPNLPEGTQAEREIGLYGHAKQDAALFFGEWRFDYLKVDGCGVAGYGADAPSVASGQYRLFPPLVVASSIDRTDVAAIHQLYTETGDAIAAVRPDNDYIYSLCLWGAANVRAWGKDVGNAVRSSDDILPVWARMLHTYDSISRRALYAHPGSWNDPDMLEIGHGDFDEHHLTEARSHFSLWALTNAPLLIGYDLRDAPKALMDILGNADLIGANQDPAGNQAVLAYTSEDLDILVKTLGGDGRRKVIAVFNRGLAPADVTLLASYLKFSDAAPIVLRDLWTKHTLAPFTGETKLKVAPRETLVFEATGSRVLPNGLYLSEMPGRVNPAVDGVVHPTADPLVHRMINPWAGNRAGSSRPVYAGWGGAAADETPYAQDIAIGGLPFATGIGILANSRLEVRADRAFRTFTAKVGVDDNSPNTAAPVTFAVYADGRLVATSAPMRFGQAARTITAPVAGARIVELVARQAIGVAIPATTAWADAALLR